MNLPNPAKTVILLPSMGPQGFMPDTHAVADSLRRLNVMPLMQDIGDDFAFGLVSWDNVDLVDCSHMRGCLPNFTKYKGILEKIGRVDPEIKVIPGTRERDWIASKSAYLSALEKQNIPIIPTCHVDVGEEQENLNDAVNQALSYIENSDVREFVLKPSVSALAVGLEFIQVQKDGSFEVTIPAKGNTSSEVQKYDDQEGFVKYLRNYLRNSQSADGTFLLQEYVENLETSAVFIGGVPHYVERTTGEKHIAHGQYGGEDILIQDPKPELVERVQSVIDVLPEEIKNSPYLRIDVMELENGEYILAEIEGAGAARLFLDLAGRVDEYAQMLKDIANNQFQPERMAAQVIDASLEIEDPANDPEPEGLKIKEA